MIAFVEEIADRHSEAPALMRTHDDGLTTVRYRDLRERARACAVRLQNMGLGWGIGFCCRGPIIRTG